MRRFAAEVIIREIPKKIKESRRKNGTAAILLLKLWKFQHADKDFMKQLKGYHLVLVMHQILLDPKITHPDVDSGEASVENIVEEKDSDNADEAEEFPNENADETSGSVSFRDDQGSIGIDFHSVRREKLFTELKRDHVVFYLRKLIDYLTLIYEQEIGYDKFIPDLEYERFLSNDRRNLIASLMELHEALSNVSSTVSYPDNQGDTCVLNKNELGSIQFPMIEWYCDGLVSISIK